MSHEAARNLILTAWQAAWNSPSPGLFPVEFENLKFKRPTSGPWGRLSINPGETTPIAPGTKDSRTPFILVLQVFIPENGGTLPAYRAADVLKTLNHHVASVGDPVTTVVHFYSVGINQAPKEDGLTGFNVTIPGYFDSHAPN